MSSRIFHPNLMTHISRDRFASLADVERKTITTDGFGEEIITYVPDADLLQIACQVEPRTNRTDSEIRRPDQTIVTQPFDALLNGYYPTINEADQLRVWPREELHNILKVAHDDARAYTTLMTEIIHG